MSELLTVALVGTTKKGAASFPKPSPLGDLQKSLTGQNAERQLLLQAGVESIVDWASYTPEQQTAFPEPSPAETLSYISPEAAFLVGELLGRTVGDKALLVEACQLMDASASLLPPQLLPQALAISDRELHAAFLPVLGKRGQWLSQFDENWQWATQSKVSSDLPLDELEDHWREGLKETRLIALSQLRRQEPAVARQWLEETWSKEKAESRFELLDALSINLSNDDIPFLEGLEKDRSANVRSKASDLLCRLPDSSLSQQIREWVSPWVEYAPAGKSVGAKLLKLAGGKAHGTISVTPPSSYEDAWRKLGIAETPPQGMGNRAYWLHELVRRVPTSFWAQRFGCSPTELIEAAKDDAYGSELLQAWTIGTSLARDTEWGHALWKYWLEFQPTGKQPVTSVKGNMLSSVASVMTSDQLEPLILEAIRHSSTELPLDAVLEQLASPWSQKFGTAILGASRKVLAQPQQSEAAVRWTAVLSRVAAALPKECLTEAVAEWLLPDSDDYFVRHVRKQIEQFQETIRTRLRLHELIGGN
jgi:hypothetical protein